MLLTNNYYYVIFEFQSICFKIFGGITMEKVKTAVIGLGQRGSSMIKHLLLGMDNCEIVAVCDVYQDRVDAAKGMIKEKT